ncbi:MAG: class I SAM-dependent methyltransferase [Ekhidna sp.]|nr:class I SAM-dependent methyltransferase [Ekhidna sp.]
MITLRKIKKNLVQYNAYFKYKNNPFGTRPLGSKEEYLKLFHEIKNKKYDLIDKIEEKNNFSLDKNWLNNLALQTQIVKKRDQLNYQHGRLIYSYLRKYLLNKGKEEKINIFETGTARGFSSICMARALIDSGHKGVINTIDIVPNGKKIFWNCISDAEGKKTRLELLNFWKEELQYINFIEGLTSRRINKLKFEKIDFAFLDGQHDKESVLEEYSFVKKHQIKGDIIIFDDFSKAYNEIKQAVELIKKEKSYTVSTFEYSDENRGYAIAEKV